MALSNLSSMPTFETFLALLQPTGNSGLTSEVFRDSNQVQRVTQGARAFSGANVSNESTDQATIQQDASANNSKDITITPTSGALIPNSPGLGPRVSQVIIGSGQLGSGVVGFSQDQGINQTSFGSLSDAQGNRSQASNSAVQNEGTEVSLNVQSDLNVTLRPPEANNDQPSVTSVGVGTDLSGLGAVGRIGAGSGASAAGSVGMALPTIPAFREATFGLGGAGFSNDLSPFLAARGSILPNVPPNSLLGQLLNRASSGGIINFSV